MEIKDIQHAVDHHRETVLVIMLGSSPQLITETLFGIHKDGLEFPTKIKVITTVFGKNALEEKRFFDETLSPLVAMCKEWGLPHVQFSESDVRLILDDQRQPLEDIRTPEDNNYLAECIFQLIKRLRTEKQTLNFWELRDECLNEKEYKKFLKLSKEQKSAFKKPEQYKALLSEPLQEYLNNNPGVTIKVSKRGEEFTFKVTYESYKIHSSIAGGRKTMSFYFGHIMSLMGRKYDLSSHVLVDDKVIGTEFFYPTKESTLLEIRNPRQANNASDNKQFIDAKDIEVNLCVLPVLTPDVQSKLAGEFSTIGSYQELMALSQGLEPLPEGHKFLAELSLGVNQKPEVTLSAGKYMKPTEISFEYFVRLYTFSRLAEFCDTTYKEYAYNYRRLHIVSLMELLFRMHGISTPINCSDFWNSRDDDALDAPLLAMLEEFSLDPHTVEIVEDVALKFSSQSIRYDKDKKLSERFSFSEDNGLAIDNVVGRVRNSKSGKRIPTIYFDEMVPPIKSGTFQLSRLKDKFEVKFV